MRDLLKPLKVTAFALALTATSWAQAASESTDPGQMGPAANEDGAAAVQLAQTGSGQDGQTIQLGTPPPPLGQQGQSLQIGTPPPTTTPETSGQTLQLGTPPPPPAGGSLQLGTPPPAPAGGSLQIGTPAQAAPTAPTLAPPEEERTVTFSFPWLRAEGGWHPQDGSRADASGLLSGAVRAEVRPPDLERWTFQATVRADAYPQSGRLDDHSSSLDYGETFVRYDGDHTRITLGAQTVLWGRVDEIPPTDRMSVQDGSRYIVDELSDRRRAVPALRIEHSLDSYKIDAMLMPWFRPAELPDRESLWHPVRQEDGRIIGIRATPLYRAAIRAGTVGRTDDFDDFGGAGIRVSRRGSGFDAAATVQRTRHSLPYYQLDPLVRAAVLQGRSVAAAIASGSGPTFREVHPLTWVAGADAEFEALGGTVRLEAAWLSDFPVTTFDARLETHDAVDWVGGYEFFPGDGNTRVTLQLAGHHVLGAPSGILDRKRIVSFMGEAEVPFAQDRWRFAARFALGLNDRDIYLNPKLSYVGWEPHEIYLGAHLFSGSESTFNGYHADNDMVVLGWRAKF